MEFVVVDAGVLGAGGEGFALEDRGAFGHGEDLGGAGDVVYFRQREHAFHDVLFVKRTRCVRDTYSSVDGVWVDAAGVTIACEGDEAGHVFELSTAEFVVETAEPGLEGQPPAGEHGDGLKFRAVTVAVEVFELAADGG